MIKTHSSLILIAASAAIALGPAISHAALLAFDDFSTYNSGNLNGQDGDAGSGDPLGFSGTFWNDNNSGNTNAGRRVNIVGNTAVNPISGQTTNYNRAFATTLADGSDLDSTNDVIWIRVNMSGSNAAGQFSTLVFGDSSSANNGSMRLNADANLKIDFVTSSGQNAGAVDSATILVNDGAFHEWLVKIDFGAGSGEAWIDADLDNFDESGGSGFTLPTAWETLTHVRIQSAGANSGPAIDDFRIGQTALDVGAIPEPSSLALVLMGFLAVQRRRRD